jgi:Domain of unknown function (DUF4190)
VTSAPPPSAPPPPPAAQWAGAAPATYQRTNGLAIASLVLGLCFCVGFTGILAVVFGNVARNKIDASNGTEKGRGLAIAGIVLGWVGIALLAIPAIVWFGYGVSNL